MTEARNGSRSVCVTMREAAVVRLNMSVKRTINTVWRLGRAVVIVVYKLTELQSR